MNFRTSSGTRCGKSIRTLAAVLIGIVSVATVQPFHPATASAQSPVQSASVDDHSSRRAPSEDPAPISADDRGHDHGDDQRGDRDDDEGPDDTIVSPPVTVPDSSTPIFFGVIAAAVLSGASALAVRRARRQPVERG